MCCTQTLRHRKQHGWKRHKQHYRFWRRSAKRNNSNTPGVAFSNNDQNHHRSDGSRGKRTCRGCVLQVQDTLPAGKVGLHRKSKLHRRPCVRVTHRSVLRGILPRRRYEGLMDDVFCKLWLSQILLWGLMSSSLYNLMAISVERYVAIVHPIWHKVSFTKTKANALVVFIWLFGVLSIASYVIPTTRIKDGRCLISVFWPSREIAAAVGVLQAFLNMILPILVHCICYARILAVLRKRVTKVMPIDSRGTHSCTSTQTRATVHESTFMPSNSAGGTLPFPARSTCSKTFPVIRQLSQNSLNEKAKRNVIKTLAIVTVCYFVCWMPNKIYIGIKDCYLN